MELWGESGSPWARLWSVFHDVCGGDLYNIYCIGESEWAPSLMNTSYGFHSSIILFLSLAVELKMYTYTGYRIVDLWSLRIRDVPGKFVSARG